MRVTEFLYDQCSKALQNWHAWKARRGPARGPLPRENWPASLSDPTAFYFECLRFFHRELPRELREHRAYFHNSLHDRRGFGEDAFHTLWYFLALEIRPSNFLEIGVFRGQVISLVSLCSSLQRMPCEVWGIAPFSHAGDSVSTYRQDIDYYQDTLANFDHLSLPHPRLLKAFSTDPKAVALIQSRIWDLIYIDGNHDYEVVRQDWDVCSGNIRAGGVIVLDDAGLGTAFNPPMFASKGHPGPSRLAKEIDPSKFREILQVGHNRAFQRVA
jgi:hypothetical protein